VYTWPGASMWYQQNLAVRGLMVWSERKLPKVVLSVHANVRWRVGDCSNLS